jgi:hypothetical protein
LREVLARVAARKDAAVDLRVQRLDAPVEHFREAGVRRHFGDRDAFLHEQAGRTARGEDLHAERGEPARELDHARLVGDADERPRDLHRQGLSCETFTP